MRQFLIFMFLLLFSGCSSTIGTNVAHPPKPYNQVYYRFEKGLFLPNRYYLTVVNHSEKSVAFHTEGPSNFLTLNNGTIVPMVHPVGSFNVMDKGMVWINPGNDFSISFDISKDELRYARTITFVGETAVGKKDGEVWFVTPDRQLVVTYDVRTTEFSVKDEPLPVGNNVQKLLGARQGDPLAPVDQDQFKMRPQIEPAF